jgi:hypothetical protein
MIPICVSDERTELATLTPRLRILLIIAALATSATHVFGEDLNSEQNPLLGFVEGDYVIVGREPDGGASYSGTARIELNHGELSLNRRQGEHEITATGRFEVPSPPNEGRVGADLDNYARLTCYWLREGLRPAEPGLEAMFPTSAWEPRTVVRATSLRADSWGIRA